VLAERVLAGPVLAEAVLAGAGRGKCRPDNALDAKVTRGRDTTVEDGR